MTLSDEERRRYSRQILLPEIGLAGQEKLKTSSMLVIGAGGLGSALIPYLAAAGVGTIGIADHDRVELSNLQRQVLHETGDIGRAKVESARNRVEELNPDIKVITHAIRVDETNAESLINDYDIVADGCDNFPTRLAVADACHRLKKPLVSAAIQGFEGQLSTFKSHLGAPHPCYRCLLSAMPSHAVTCAENGVVGPLAGLMGSWQALEVIKELLGIGSSLSGILIRLNSLTAETRRSQLPRDPACPTCA